MTPARKNAGLAAVQLTLCRLAALFATFDAAVAGPTPDIGLCDEIRREAGTTVESVLAAYGEPRHIKREAVPNPHDARSPNRRTVLHYSGGGFVAVFEATTVDRSLLEAAAFDSAFPGGATARWLGSDFERIRAAFGPEESGSPATLNYQCSWEGTDGISFHGSGNRVESIVFHGWID